MEAISSSYRSQARTCATILVSKFSEHIAIPWDTLWTVTEFAAAKTCTDCSIKSARCVSSTFGTSCLLCMECVVKGESYKPYPGDPPTPFPFGVETLCISTLTHSWVECILEHCSETLKELLIEDHVDLATQDWNTLCENLVQLEFLFLPKEALQRLPPGQQPFQNLRENVSIKIKPTQLYSRNWYYTTSEGFALPLGSPCVSSLDCQGCKLSNDGILALSSYVGLKRLNLSKNMLDDIREVGECRCLEVLDVSHNILDDHAMRVLDNLHSLKTFILSSCLRVTQLPGLQYCPLLTKLIVDNTGLTSEGLAEICSFCPRLTEISLESCEDIKTVTSLGLCACLKTIILARTNVSSIDHGALPSSIETLDLSMSPITSLTFLQNLTQLKVLKLCGCGRVRSLDGVEFCTALNDLDLSLIPLRNKLTPLQYSSCSSILSLNLDSTHVTADDVKSLMSLTNLTYLSVRGGNPQFGFELTDILEYIPSLRRLSVSSYSVEFLQSQLES
eukprot:PhF_6_TR25180/c0_g1_i2/m.34743